MTMTMTKHVVGVRLWSTLMLIVGLGTGCSLLLDWDPNNQPCNTDQTQPDCDDGYSCASGLCVSDRSIPRGDSCAKDKQCVEYPAGICTPNPSVCRVQCTTYYGPTECESGYYCRPSTESTSTTGTSTTSTSTTGTSTTRGSCVASECPTPGAATGCANKQYCFKIASSANACLASCGKPTTANPSSSLGYCASTSTCQPVGVSGSVSLACIAKSKTVVPLGGTCDLGAATCDQAGACIGASLGATDPAICRTLCDPAAAVGTTGACASPATCQSVAASGGTFGFCQ